MSTVIAGAHLSPDIWVIQGEDKTGFQMLTERAKVWARAFKEVEPEELEHVLWVPANVGSIILHDLATDTQLHVLLDTLEIQAHA